MGCTTSSSTDDSKRNDHIVFIGDSTLDNLVWVNGQHQTVKHHLETMMPSATVVNYAADGYRTIHVLNGGTPSISGSARQKAGDPFPAGWNRGTIGFNPLEHLRKLDVVTHIVLSVGGNDIRVILGAMYKLQEVVASFLEMYPKVLDACLESTPNVIIQMQYRPSYINDCYGVYSAMKSIPGKGTPVAKLNNLMENIYKDIISLAKKKKIPFIDLPNTFDYRDDSLYKMQIEPSNKGGKKIAKLIKHVVESHDFNGISKFYSQTSSGKIHVCDNDGSKNWTLKEL